MEKLEDSESKNTLNGEKPCNPFAGLLFLKHNFYYKSMSKKDEHEMIK